MKDIKAEFLQYVDGLCRFWSKQGGTPLDVAKGVAFSILVAIDGYGDLPPFALIPQTEELNQNIAGSLHDDFSIMSKEEE